MNPLLFAILGNAASFRSARREGKAEQRGKTEKGGVSL